MLRNTILMLLLWSQMAVAGDLFDPIEGNPDVESQVNGVYPPLNRSETLPLGMIQSVWSQAKPESGIREYQHDPRKVIPVVVREYMSSEIELPSFEVVEENNVIPGDKDTFRYQIIKHNIISIRSTRVGVDSSLKVVGQSGLVYTFYVVAHGYNSRQIPDLHVIVRAASPKYPMIQGQYVTPVEAAAHFQQKSTEGKSGVSDDPDYLQKVVVEASKLDFDFTMRGDKSIAPHRVFTDGRQTWFDYQGKIEKGELPVIAALIDGVETPINVRRDAANRLVADYCGHFSLKFGAKTVCVFYHTEGLSKSKNRQK